MLNVFTTDRVGTPITEEERAEITKELEDLYRVFSDEESIKKDAEKMTDLLGFTWSPEWTAVALSADIWGYEETLRTGVVAAW
ncbi:hypothetical protein nepoznato_119 [Escherichia phage nepoznato]|uniref:Uncharacterized protein n=1 Tax=Escherichia phage nepoznato TaxID=2696431 RepID=A0A6B9WP33_9CAUD|nr:hypothetical protein JR323_gp158 [Escherichia phage nepoznato]QHR65568.1 hypothetical protein nepoznato_119 [Escherichia phage nepoznato]UPW38717.1 hypothetical protein ESCO37_00233 [Escherichia phage vB_EcoM_ESCO37]UPW40133.1 hypothetical protein REC_00095 [Escherichia phage vB_EcoM_REC]